MTRPGEHFVPAAASGSAAAAVLLALTLLVAAAVAPHAVQAQGNARQQCSSATTSEVQEFCRNVVDAVLVLQPRVGIALTGGNPVPGSASTLGMRLGTLPRVSLGARVTAAAVDLPPIVHLSSSEDVAFPVGSIALDGSVGLFSGFSLLPTIGGVGSIDVLASVGFIPLPDGDGFSDSSPFTWSLGARLGLLQESFTAPGVSVSAMYRRLGSIAYGDSLLEERDAYLAVEDYDLVSVRGAVGKRLLGFGLTAGVGYDSYSSDIRALLLEPVFNGRHEVSQEGVRINRLSAWGNASLTLLILNLVAELGWQQGGDAPTDAAAPKKLEKAGIFGGVAIRIAI